VPSRLRIATRVNATLLAVWFHRLIDRSTLTTSGCSERQLPGSLLARLPVVVQISGNPQMSAQSPRIRRVAPEEGGLPPDQAAVRARSPRNGARRGRTRRITSERPLRADTATVSRCQRSDSRALSRHSGRSRLRSDIRWALCQVHGLSADASDSCCAVRPWKPAIPVLSCGRQRRRGSAPSMPSREVVQRIIPPRWRP